MAIFLRTGVSGKSAVDLARDLLNDVGGLRALLTAEKPAFEAEFAQIFAHNHPSGIADPPSADHQLTRTLKDALGLLDIHVLHRMIIGNGEVVSFAEHGWL